MQLNVQISQGCVTARLR